MTEQTAEARTDALIKAGSDPKHWYSVALDADLMPQPKNLAEMYFICEFFAANGMAPKGLETPKKMMAAWIYGKQLGFGFWASLRNIAVINNRAAVYGPAVLGLVRKSQKLESIKEWQEGTGMARVAYCEAKRKGDPEIYKGEFSMEDAQVAGLLDKDTTWKKYPKDMLKYKARARALYNGFSDVLESVTMYEEAVDYEEAEVVKEGKSVFDDVPPPKPEEDAPEEEQGEVVDAGEPEEDYAPPHGKTAADVAQDISQVTTKQEAQEGHPHMTLERLRFEDFLEEQKPDELHRLACNAVLQEVAEFHKVSISEVKASAERQWPKFWSNVQQYAKANKKRLMPEPPAGKDTGETNVNFWENRDNWINARGKGYQKLVFDHLQELEAMPDDFIFNEAFGKWNRIQEDLGPFPLMKAVVAFAKEHNIDPKHLLPQKGPEGQEPPMEPTKKAVPSRDHIPDNLKDLHTLIAAEWNYDGDLVEQISKEVETPLDSPNVDKCRELLMSIYVVYGVDVDELTRKF